MLVRTVDKTVEAAVEVIASEDRILGMEVVVMKFNKMIVVLLRTEVL